MEAVQQRTGRRLACERCHRHKLRCLRDAGLKCVRCTKMGVCCEDRSERPMGRPKISEVTEKMPRKRSTTSSSSSSLQSLNVDGMSFVTIPQKSTRQSEEHKSQGHSTIDSVNTFYPPRKPSSGAYDLTPTTSEDLDPKCFDFDTFQVYFEENEMSTQDWQNQALSSNGITDMWTIPGMEMLKELDTQEIIEPARTQEISRGPSTPDSRPGFPSSISSSNASIASSDTIENCIEKLSQLHISLSRLSLTCSNAVAYEEVSPQRFPFEALLPSTRSSSSSSSTSAKPSRSSSWETSTAEQQALGENAKKLFGMSYAFISILTNLVLLISQEPPKMTRTADPATVLLTLTCYMRLLSSYSSMVSEIGRLNKKVLQQQGRGHLSSQGQRPAMPLLPHVDTPLLIQMTSHLLDRLDHKLQEYLCTEVSDTQETLLPDMCLFGTAKRSSPPKRGSENRDESGAARVALRSAVVAMDSSREKLRKELRLCESSIIDMM